MTTEILGHTLEEWSPMSPTKGPPLPEFLNQYWPWYKAATPSPGLGTLILTVNTASAAIILDGSPITSGTYNSVMPGTYAWSASVSGYTSQSGIVTIVDGQTTNLNIVLVATSVPPPPPPPVSPLFSIGNIIRRTSLGDNSYYDSMVYAVDQTAQTYTLYYIRLPLGDQELQVRSFTDVHAGYVKVG